MNNDLRLRQICLVVQDLTALEAHLATVLDLHAVHQDPNLSRYGLENRIFALGPRFVEVVAPIEENTAAGRFLERSEGRGGYMAIFDCNDPEQRALHAESLGVPVISRLHHESYTGRQLHPRDCRAAMIEFNRTDGGEALDGPYWPAGPDWQRGAVSSVAQRLDGIDLSTPVPEDLALHWAKILQTGAGEKQHDFRIDTDGIDIRFRFGDDPRERLDALRVTVSDMERVLESARQRNLPTGPDYFELAGVDWRLRAA